MEEWAGKVKTDHLPARALWQSYTQQLWSSMKCGLGVSVATLEEIENDLGLTDFYLISKLGVAQEKPTEPRYMPHHFWGMELSSPMVKTTVAQINCLLQHYGTYMALEATLTAGIEHL